jgi:hypothetical protein
LTLSRDEVNRRDVCECDGEYVVLIDDPSMLRLTLKSASWLGCCRLLLVVAQRTPHGGSGRVHGHVAQAELLKLKKRGQFPDESVRITV